MQRRLFILASLVAPAVVSTAVAAPAATPAAPPSSPPQGDKLKECNDPQTGFYMQDPQAFEKTWCFVCRNGACVRARGGWPS